MINAIKRWRHGVCKLKNVNFPYVRLLRAVPTKVDMNNLRIMEEVFRILHKRKSVFSFEIWKDEGIGFYFYSSGKDVEKELSLQLNSVYPCLEIEQARFSMPELKGYVSGGAIRFKGQAFNLKTLDDFDYDPLIHLLEAVDSKCVIQIMFKPFRKILEIHRNGVSEHPIFQCMIRVIASSENYKKARTSCERILNSFTVFNTHASQLEPRLISFPVLRNSFGLLKQIAKRRFPLFSKFLTTSKELAAFVHLPINAEEHGIRYARPTKSAYGYSIFS